MELPKSWMLPGCVKWRSTQVAHTAHSSKCWEGSETKRNGTVRHGTAQNEMKRMAGNNIKRHDTSCGASRKQPRWHFLNLINFQLPQLIHTHIHCTHTRTHAHTRAHVMCTHTLGSAGILFRFCFTLGAWLNLKVNADAKSSAFQFQLILTFSQVLFILLFLFRLPSVCPLDKH